MWNKIQKKCETQILRYWICENGISKTTTLTTSLTLKTMGLVLNKLWLFAASQLRRVSQVIQTAGCTSNCRTQCQVKPWESADLERWEAAAIATQDIQLRGDRFWFSLLLHSSSPLSPFWAVLGSQRLLPPFPQAIAAQGWCQGGCLTAPTGNPNPSCTFIGIKLRPRMFLQ